MARPRDERGAVALFTAVALSLVLVMGAFAVDLGMQRVLRRDLQALADAVATDLARELDGRSAAAITADPGWAAARADSVDRNDEGLADAPTVTATLGTVDAAYVFTAVSGATVPTAVRVEAAGEVDFAFATGSGGASRSAVTVTRAQACYKLGSWGARLDTLANANLLYEVLAAHGVGASVEVATYQDLVGASVDLAALATELGLASPEELATTNVALGTLLDAVAAVLPAGGATEVQADALDVVRANLGGLAPEPVALATLLSVASGSGAGLVAVLDLADLVIGALLVADGNSAVDVSIDAGLTGLGTLATRISLIQAARVACGFAGATPNTSNQVELTAEAALTDRPLTLGLPFLAAVRVDTDDPLELSVTTAAATSTLEAVRCPSSARSAEVDTAGGLLNATLVVPLSVTVTTLGFLQVPVDLTVRATLSPTASAKTVTITVPSQEYATPYSNGGTALQLPNATVQAPGSVAGMTPTQLTALVGSLTRTVVTPLVDALNASLLRPLSDLLGLRTTGADVLLLDHPSCTTPALRG